MGGASWSKVFDTQIDALKSIMMASYEAQKSLMSAQMSGAQPDMQAMQAAEDKMKNKAISDKKAAEDTFASQINDLYAKYDKNGDGKLDDAEVESLVKEGFEELKKQGPHMIDAATDIAMFMLESMHEGINMQMDMMKKQVPAEHWEMMKSQMPKPPTWSELKAKFNENSAVARDSFSAYLNSEVDGKLANIKEISAAIFQKMDKDGDKSISKEEFSAAFVEIASKEISIENQFQRAMEPLMMSAQNSLQSLFPAGGNCLIM